VKTVVKVSDIAALNLVSKNTSIDCNSLTELESVACTRSLYQCYNLQYDKQSFAFGMVSGQRDVLILFYLGSENGIT
jgi:hypothetical protein